MYRVRRSPERERGGGLEGERVTLAGLPDHPVAYAPGSFRHRDFARAAPEMAAR